MNLLEAKKLLKNNGYRINRLDECAGHDFEYFGDDYHPKHHYGSNDTSKESSDDSRGYMGISVREPASRTTKSQPKKRQDDKELEGLISKFKNKYDEISDELEQIDSNLKLDFEKKLFDYDSKSDLKGIVKLPLCYVFNVGDTAYKVAIGSVGVSAAGNMKISIPVYEIESKFNGVLAKDTHRNAVSISFNAKVNNGSYSSGGCGGHSQGDYAQFKTIKQAAATIEENINIIEEFATFVSRIDRYKHVEENED